MESTAESKSRCTYFFLLCNLCTCHTACLFLPDFFCTGNKHVEQIFGIFWGQNQAGCFFCCFLFSLFLEERTSI